MSQSDHDSNMVMALSTPDPETLDEDLQKFFGKCQEKLGLIPNVLKSYSLRPRKLRNFISLYNELMLGESGLSKLEREMIAVVVSSVNRCYYCLVAHGQAVRELSGNPQLGEMLVMNYRVAPLSEKNRAMLDFAWKLTVEPYRIEENDRQKLREVGFSEEDIFDIADVTGFYNMSNRVASGVEMNPNKEYHTRNR
ncbi:Alkyl hydroperoxide reductase AhpD [Azospirillaceae bacterium]